MSDEVKHILFVEDEVKVARIIEGYLLKSGYSVNTLHTGAGVVDSVRNLEPDLILLDIMLPEVDGITICREIRNFSDVPIILLTAKVEELDRILGFDTGADDYICKPVNPREILSRVKAALRRAGPTQTKKQVLLEFDDSRLLATYLGQRLDLTLKEFQLLKMLYLGEGKIFSREQIRKKVYGPSRANNSRTVDAAIKKLRDKISLAVEGESPIRSIYGAGYSFEPPSVSE